MANRVRGLLGPAALGSKPSNSEKTKPERRKGPAAIVGMVLF